MTKAWSGRFDAGAHPTAERFTASLDFDRRLWPYDIQGSLAWARALARAALLTPSEHEAIAGGLARIVAELTGGSFPFRPQLEDIHINIERRLLERVGPVAGKLHTGRSRNDQIALDERLYLKEVCDGASQGLREVQRVLIGRAGESLDVAMPGYTHLQRAQPILLGH